MDQLLTILLFIQNIFVFRKLVRVLESYVEKKQMNSFSFAQISTIYMFWSFSLLYFFGFNFVFLLFMQFVPLLTPDILVFCLKKRREYLFKKRLLSFLNRFILKMKSGLSFREGFQQICLIEETFLGNTLNDLYVAVVFSQQKAKAKSSFYSLFIEELREVDQSSGQQIKKLEFLREKYRIQNYFKRRSGQIASQVRAQSIVLSLIYIALLFWNLTQFSIDSIFYELIISLFLFLAGLVIVFKIGRRIRWKL